MATAGTVGTIRKQLEDGLSAVVTQSLAIAIVCFIPLIGSISSPSPFPTLGVFAYGGIVTLFVGVATIAGPKRVGDLSENEPTRLVISLVLGIYLNVMFLMAFGVGYAVWESLTPTLAIFAALATPTLDYRISNAGLPGVHWLTAVVIGLIQRIARLFELVLGSDGLFTESLTEARQLLESPDTVIETVNHPMKFVRNRN